MKWIIILYVLLVLSSCQNKPEGYVIKGELKGAPENEWVFLTDVDQDVFYDSVQLKKGYFEFRGNVANPELRCITCFKDPSQRIYGWDKILMVPIYVENSEIQFTLPFSDMPTSIEGSHVYDLYMRYKKQVTPFVVKNDSLFKAYGSAYYYKKVRKKMCFVA